MSSHNETLLDAIQYLTSRSATTPMVAIYCHWTINATFTILTVAEKARLIYWDLKGQMWSSTMDGIKLVDRYYNRQQLNAEEFDWGDLLD